MKLAALLAAVLVAGVLAQTNYEELFLETPRLAVPLIPSYARTDNLQRYPML